MQYQQLPATGPAGSVLDHLERHEHFLPAHAAVVLLACPFMIVSCSAPLAPEVDIGMKHSVVGYHYRIVGSQNQYPLAVTPQTGGGDCDAVSADLCYAPKGAQRVGPGRHTNHRGPS